MRPLAIVTAAYLTMAKLYLVNRAKYLAFAKAIVGTYLAFSDAFSVIGWLPRESILTYVYGHNGRTYCSLYLLSTFWIGSGIFGSIVTGCFVLSAQTRLAYRLNLIAMAVTLTIGIPAAFTIGSIGRVAAILAGQSVVIITALYFWGVEHRMIKLTHDKHLVPKAHPRAPKNNFVF